MRNGLHVKSLSTQRNGISGEGFFVLEFTYKPVGTPPVDLLAITPFTYVDDQTGRDVEFYVLTPTNLTEGWRGDHFAVPLMAWIRVNSDVAWPNMYPEAAKNTDWFIDWKTKR